ncbi:autophagy-related protein 18h isoform X2 [Neltuma alba]|uniref:autophagy-related protein 18h isoform X2 n=1 Tax=Neltuma alba TaxID=207710 RepID=UPI0010A36611|nr:autophagy-related protein 18h isoform X2 [Prosopis alba]
MKHHAKENNSKSNGFIPSSFKFISSCIKTASSGVLSASASVAASIAADGHDRKDQVLWACFDRLELGPFSFKHVLLLGYSNGFQVLDVDDASNVCELVSKRDDPVSFLQMQPIPKKSEGCKGFSASHPLLLVVACDKSKIPGTMQNGRDGYTEPQAENVVSSATAVRFYSLRFHSYVHALRFRSTVYMVRCSPQIVAVGLAAQIYCFDALTLENKFSVLTYPVPQLGVQGMGGVNIGYGPMAVGPRWLAYASNNPLPSNTGRLSPQSLTPPAVSPSTSPGNGNLVARYAMESSKHLAAGLINLGDMGYKTLSKYYQDLMPDGSNSPVPSNSNWKVSRYSPHSTEADTAGVVVIKDFVSRAVAAQFRAHTSPISALSFDPSGTLLVTASIHGNNLNIFRIMPSGSKNGSGSQSSEWSCSHAHLYKLHRGMTSAVIQDICFSHYSQWVAIISSKGTCHIFVLAPFGGETVLQIQNPDMERPTLLPIFSLPWWFTPHFTANQQQFSLAPPPPVTLSVVSRIKNSNAGWLNNVSNAASSAAGKVSVPSGAVSAIFHSSMPYDTQNAHLKAQALEYLLVYSPSGHLVQYKLLPSMAAETSETAPGTAPAPSTQIQEEDLRVKVEPIQWWDVCRRNDWPEREEYISGKSLSGQEAAEMSLENSGYEYDDVASNNIIKCNEKCLFSNAEVQMNSGRIPIWQKSEVSFYVISPLEVKEQNLCDGHQTNGEIEIEKIPVIEVEIRQKDLLPVFNHFHGIHSTWGDRFSSSSSDSHGVEEKFSEDAVINHSKSMVPSSSEKTDGGLSACFASSNGLSSNETDCKSREDATVASPVLRQEMVFEEDVSIGASHFADSVKAVAKLSESTRTSDDLNTSLDGYNFNTNVVDGEPVDNSPDFPQFFQEGYCKAADECDETTEVVNDVDCGRLKPGDNSDDDMLGCVFDFSEEG